MAGGGGGGEGGRLRFKSSLSINLKVLALETLRLGRTLFPK